MRVAFSSSGWLDYDRKESSKFEVFGKMKGKRITFRSYNPGVIEFLNSLPRGYRSYIIESALAAYMKTGVGKDLMHGLEKGRKEQETNLLQGSETKGLLERLKGDFD